MRQIIFTHQVRDEKEPMLCNALFPFANALAAGREYGWQVVFPGIMQYSKYFCGSSNSSHWKLGCHVAGCSGYPQLDRLLTRARAAYCRRVKPDCVFSGNEENPVKLDEILPKSRDKSLLWLDGIHCLANKSFIKHSDFIRRYFRPVDSVRCEVDSLVERARQGRQGVDVLVGVHMRQGGYKSLLNFSTPEYAELMHQMERELAPRKVRFVVCYTVKPESQDLRGLDWLSGPGSQIGDLYTLAACDYIIGAPSTYNQWASFYGRVPSFIYNRKYEEMYGMEITRLSLASFKRFVCGYSHYLVCK